MSIHNLDRAAQEAERRRKLAALAESVAGIASDQGFSTEELSEALKRAIDLKRLEKTQAEVQAMKDKGITR